MDNAVENPTVLQSVLQLDVQSTTTNSATQRDSAVATPDDRISLLISDQSKALSVLAQKILSKLDDVLKNDVPGGVYQLKPEDHTPEKTADNIVNGVVGLFGGYAQNHPELKGEDLVDAFITEVKKGVQSGYEDAAGLLESIGAFDFPGLKDGIEKTMQLVEEKLNSFADQLKHQLVSSTADSQAASQTSATDATETNSEASEPAQKATVSATA